MSDLPTIPHDKEQYLYTVHDVPHGIYRVRLDYYLGVTAQVMPSKKYAYKAAKRGEILLNGLSVEASRYLTGGEQLRILHREQIHKPFPLRFPVVFEDDDLAVIHKPPGYPVNGNGHRTIERALGTNLFPSNRTSALLNPKPVHRLDRATGGLLLIAKTIDSVTELSRQFQARTIKKKYRAIVIGRLEGYGDITEPLEGRPAKTQYQSIEHTRSLATDWLTTVELNLITGRTHQLRKHLTSVGHPIFGDGLYHNHAPVYQGKGLFLWSTTLDFQHPVSGERIQITIAEPPKFNALRLREDRRWHRYFSGAN